MRKIVRRSYSFAPESLQRELKKVRKIKAEYVKMEKQIISDMQNFCPHNQTYYKMEALQPYKSSFDFVDSTTMMPAPRRYCSICGKKI